MVFDRACKMKSAMIFRTILEGDISRIGNHLVTALLAESGFDLDGPVSRYYDPPSASWCFFQHVNWKDSREFKQIREHLKQSTPIHTGKPKGLIYAP